MPIADVNLDNSYDRVPYPSWPYAQSHPDRMAAIATLLGLHPCPVDNASVLEVGCVAGGNLIPMAAMYPNSRFLGIDLSVREIAEGNERIEALGLRNIELRQQDILAFPETAGPFDYLIAHGVYSWVPDIVQERLFAICRDQLQQHGLAYISYNTLPGWRMRGMIRDMLVYHSSQFREPQKQVEQARAILQFLAASVATDTAYGALLKQELELFQRISDEYIYHDHLARDNTPVYFHEFMRNAELYGMQYLGEPHLSTMATSTFPTEVESTLERISKDVVQVEQYMDFLKNRAFRQTILCRSHEVVDRTLSPQNIRRLSFSSPLEMTEGESDEQGNGDGLPVFERKGVRFSTDFQPLRVAIEALTQAWPRWLGFDELLAIVQAKHQGDGSAVSTDAAVADELAAHLMRSYAMNCVHVHVGASKFIATISDRPMACPLARVQAETSVKVTNRKHEVVALDETTRRILQMLDGHRSANELVNNLRGQIKDGPDSIRIGGQSVSNDDINNLLLRQVQTSLEKIRRAALLVG